MAPSGMPSRPRTMSAWAKLVARHWFEYVFAGQTATVERWLGVLPEELITADAALVLVKAWISALYGRSEERDRNYPDLAEGIPYEGPLPDGTASVEAGVATIRAVFGFGGVQSTLEAARQAAALGARANLAVGRAGDLGLGHGLYLSGDSSGAESGSKRLFVLTRVAKPLVCGWPCCSGLSFVAQTRDAWRRPSHSRARRATLVDRFRLQRVPQATAGAHRTRTRARRARGTSRRPKPSSRVVFLCDEGSCPI